MTTKIRHTHVKLHECAEAKLEEDVYKTVQTAGLLFIHYLQHSGQIRTLVCCEFS